MNRNPRGERKEPLSERDRLRLTLSLLIPALTAHLHDFRSFHMNEKNRGKTEGLDAYRKMILNVPSTRWPADLSSYYVSMSVLAIVRQINENDLGMLSPDDGISGPTEIDLMDSIDNEFKAMKEMFGDEIVADVFSDARIRVRHQANRVEAADEAMLKIGRLLGTIE